MSCYHPLPAWYSRKLGTSGKRGITFRPGDGFKDRPLEVPCGTCVGCQLERSRQWAVRCLHESKLHEDNCFVTLTYGETPPGGSLRPVDFVEFMKRLRWHHGEGIRFFQCGEYGDELGRPHHHALLFNLRFPDLRFYKESSGVRLYTSAKLDSLWGHGFCSVGDVSFESAAYIARYTMKKVHGPAAAAHYGDRVPEYLTMSRRPGIGRGWVEKYRHQTYRNDELVVRGHPCKPPRYYDQVQEKEAPTVLARVKARRRVLSAVQAKSLRSQLGPSAPYVRERVKEAAISNLRRVLEGGL